MTMHSHHAVADKHGRLEEDPTYARKYHLARRNVPGTIVYEQYWDSVLMGLLPRDPSLRVLDLMCGEGIFLPALRRRYRSVYGIDISREMLKLVDEEFRPIVCAADVLALPLADGAVDAVVVRGGLHHMAHHLDAAIAEIRRVLAPGGRLVVLEPCDDNPLIGVIRQTVYRFSSHFDEDEESGLKSRDLARALRTHGFTINTVLHSGFVGYALLLNTDALPVLQRLHRLPGATSIAKLLIRFDHVWERLPVLGSVTFNMFMAATCSADQPGQRISRSA
jgi:ubiquinone/menaquinone biosynthesis C-methylase UbiE